METLNFIVCPSCGTKIDIEKVLADQTERRLRAEFEEKYNKKIHEIESRNLEIEQRNLELKKKEEEFEEKRRKANEIFQEQLQKKLAEEKQRQELELQKKYYAQIQASQEEIAKKEQEIRYLKEKEIELMRKDEEIRTLKERQNLEIEKRLIEEKNKIAEQYKFQFEERLKIQLEQQAAQFQLQIKELQIQLEQQKKLAEELSNKASQKSMELQGEAQERKLEEILKSEFQFDKIEDVPKGYTGADVIQTVIDEQGKIAGKIIYESKRTKEFSREWIPKLKDDQLQAQANFAILVTQAMPKDMERFGNRDGVWICRFEEVRQVASILRETLIQINKIRLANENKGDKMKLLYDYLTSQEFATRVQNIIDSFTSMKSELEQEKRAFQKIWKQREVQIERVINNTIDLYATFSAIAGKGVLQIESLNLPMLKEGNLFNND